MKGDLNMSLILALKKDNNIYFASESSLPINRSFIDSLDNTTTRKVDRYYDNGINILFGLVGVSRYSLFLEQLAIDIVNRVNMSFGACIREDIFDIVHNWFNKRVPADMKVSVPNSDGSNILNSELLIGISSPKDDICSLFYIMPTFDVYEINEFISIGEGSNAAKVAYDVLKSTDQLATYTPDSVLAKIIKSCSKYFSGIDDNIYSIDTTSLKYKYFHNN